MEVVIATQTFAVVVVVVMLIQILVVSISVAVEVARVVVGHTGPMDHCSLGLIVRLRFVLGVVGVRRGLVMGTPML